MKIHRVIIYHIDMVFLSELYLGLNIALIYKIPQHIGCRRRIDTSMQFEMPAYSKSLFTLSTHHVKSDDELFPALGKYSPLN